MKKIKQRKKVFTKHLDGGHLVVMRLLPWMRTENGCIWLASIAAGKSRRQINDWLKRKTRKKRVRHLDSRLTGKYSNRIQAIGIQQVRQWMEELPPGDSITLRCESAKPDKQFRVWKKWFQRWEDARWDINEEFKSFFYYKSRLVK
jgi:(p)ppGpp synthase/HD superfamily hydrolase